MNITLHEQLKPYVAKAEQDGYRYVECMSHEHTAYLAKNCFPEENRTMLIGIRDDGVHIWEDTQSHADNCVIPWMHEVYHGE